jgi:L-aspartate oxidase
MEHLEKKVRSLPNVRILENHFAVDLLSMAKYTNDNACFGAFVMDVEKSRIDTILARATVLATGGAGKVYLVTSNPDTAVGDGVAMAYRAGAAVANMEFYQFHPTCFYHPQAKGFLISEALRGEGGILRRATERRSCRPTTRARIWRRVMSWRGLSTTNSSARATIACSWI